MTDQRPTPALPESAPQRRWTIDKRQGDAVPRLRAAVRDELGAWGIDPTSDQAFAVGLVVTELVGNACAYGSPVLHLIDVTVWTDGHTVTVIVHDSTYDAPILGTASDCDESGRGLLLINAYAADHGWYRSEIGKRVWAVVEPDPLLAHNDRHTATMVAGVS